MASSRSDTFLMRSPILRNTVGLAVPLPESARLIGLHLLVWPTNPELPLTVQDPNLLADSLLFQMFHEKLGLSGAPWIAKSIPGDLCNHDLLINRDIPKGPKQLLPGVELDPSQGFSLPVRFLISLHSSVRSRLLRLMQFSFTQWTCFDHSSTFFRSKTSS